MLGIREFSQNVSRTLHAVIETGKPVLITRHGHPVAAIVAVDDDRFEDFVMAHAPEFTLGMRAADEELERGMTRPLHEVLAEADAEDADRR